MSGPSYIITTGRDGCVIPERSDDVNAIAAAARANGRIVVHLHGGLVDEAAGRAIADRLSETYLKAGASPVFMVWQSGLLEVLRNNLTAIAGEKLFKRMLMWVLQFTTGKLWQEPGQRAAGILTLPDDLQIRSELSLRDRGVEPFAATVTPSGLTDVSTDERTALEQTVENDPEVLAEVSGILAARHPETSSEGSRGVTVRREASSASLIDPEVLDAIDQGEGGERGLVSLSFLAKKCGSTLVRVIKRFRAGTDHGVYPTVFEELLREFYLANAGGSVWSAMKNETAQTFQASDRGGRQLLDKLGAALADGARPQITLVGHSTGAVYIENLLDEVTRGRDAGDRPWPDEVRFRVLYLAPASTYEHFAAMLGRSERLIADLRMFTMNDVSEQSDRLLGAVYPRSLLYLVSGALERDAHGGSAWAPLVGLARYREDSLGESEALSRGRGFLTDQRVVLSPSGTDAPPGARAAALTHGAFDDDPLVLESVSELIRGA